MDVREKSLPEYENQKHQLGKKLTNLILSRLHGTDRVYLLIISGFIELQEVREKIFTVHILYAEPL